MSKVIPYGRQTITEEDILAVAEVLRSEYLTQGPKVGEFESAFASFVGARFAVAVSSGTAALHLAVRAMGLRPGQRVLTTPTTFVASANCVRYCDGEVEFVDIHPETYCLDPDLLEKHLTEKPGAVGVIPVSYAGYPVDLEKIAAIARHHGCWVVEDACHSPGAAFRDSRNERISSGSSRYADISVFSFHPVKHIACGEGGMLTTNSEEIYRWLTLMRSHGITRDRSELSRDDGPWYYEQIELGYNYRLPDMNCALGLSQLKRMPENIRRRWEIAHTYCTELAGLPLGMPVVPPGVEHAYHLFPVQAGDRYELYMHLREQGIHSQIHYVPVHQQPYYIERYGPQQFHMAESFYKGTLSLPMYHGLGESEQAAVIHAVRDFYGGR